MTYMSRDHAQRWVTRIYDWEMLPANTGVNHFIDWDNFRASFGKEFFPLHVEAVATNVLEGTTYFQGSRSVDNYLDDFRDLILESGYTSSKTIVVKFRRGLDPQVGDAIATMAANRPNDLDPEAWYEAAVRIDQNRAMNKAFQNSVKTLDSYQPLPCELKVAEDLSNISDDKTDIQDSPKACQPLLREPEFAEDLTEIPEDETRFLDVVPPQIKSEDIKNMNKPYTPPPKKVHAPTLPKRKPPTHPLNRYQTLAVEEVHDIATDAPTGAEATCAKQPRRPRWEQRLPLVPEIGATELRRASLFLWVEVESTENQQKYGICTLVDSGASGVFIDREYVKSNQIPTIKLSTPIPVRNVDGTANTAGAITEVAELILRYNGHSERVLFCVTGLGSQNLILGHTWLQEHNPEVD